MKRVLKLRPIFVMAPLFAVLLTTSLAPFHSIIAQRSRLANPPQRELGSTPVLPAGTQVLPESTVLILEMETRLESNRSRVSDRFQASVASPVIDASGRTIIPQGAIVEGRVTNVQPAKWRSRSGIIGISFDYLVLDGRRIPIRGFLTPADERTRKQMDGEGNLKGGSSIRRNFLFIGGGAGGGATIAAITGTGILAATGIGAVAGVTASLLMKGKEAVVVERQRLGIELTSPLRVGPAWYTNQPRQTTRLPVRSRGGLSPSYPRGIIPGSGIGSNGSIRQDPQSNDPNAIRTVPGNVPVYDVRTDRTNEGYLRVFIQSETPTSGWRIYTHHILTNNNNTLEVRLKGWPGASYGYRQIDHPYAPTIIVRDPSAVVSRILVHGSNGNRTVTVNSSGTVAYEPYTPPSSQAPYRPQPDRYPSDGSSILLGPPLGTISGGSSAGVPPSSGTTELTALANRASNELEVFREYYAPEIGLLRKRDGTYEFLGTRRPTANEEQLLRTVDSMIDSARQIANNPNDAQTRRTYAVRLRDEFQVANQLWTRIQLNQDLNIRWRNIQQSAQNLISSAYR